MAEQQSVARKRSLSKGDKQEDTEAGTGQNGHEEALARYEKQLRGYLQRRIKPGLNSGNIPLLARSIAKEIIQQQPPGTSQDEDGTEALDPPDFEADMHELQAELGDEWIVQFCVHGDEAWMTAEKDDGSQRVEAPTGAVLAQVVRLLNERGGRSS